MSTPPTWPDPRNQQPRTPAPEHPPYPPQPYYAPAAPTYSQPHHGQPSYDQQPYELSAHQPRPYAQPSDFQQHDGHAYTQPAQPVAPTIQQYPLSTPAPRKSDKPLIAAAAAVLALAVAVTLFFVLRPSANDDAAEASASNVPAADASLVLTDVDADSLTATDVQNPGSSGKIITGDGTFQVASIGKLDVAFPDGKTANRAADGHTLILITATWTSELTPYDQEFDTAMSLDIDGKQTDITYDIADAEGPVSIVASVPNDATSSLTITFEGQDQTIDLSSGERESDPLTDVWYRKVTSQTVANSQTFGPTTVYSDGAGVNQQSTYKIDLDLAFLTPYGDASHGSLGWADSGNAWLIIEFTDGTSPDSGPYSGSTGVYSGWTVSADGGADLPLELVGDVSDDTAFVSFLVPADATEFSLTASTTVTFQASGLGDVDLTFGPLEATMTFPV